MSIVALIAEKAAALPPTTWLLVGLAVIALLGLHLAAYIHGYQPLVYRSFIAIALALAVGLSAIWWLPLLTNSHLAYVNSALGWIALSISALGVALVSYVYLHPLCFLVRETGD